MQGIEKTQGGRCALIIACAGFALCATAGVATAEDRTFDGTGNNVVNTGWGSAHTHLLRVGPVSYPDGSSMVTDRPNPRAISNAVSAQNGSVVNNRQLSDWVWQWGQFIDHDIDLTGGANPSQPFNIPVPAGDPLFDPANTGTQVIGLNRSAFDPATGTSPGNHRQQVNQVTAYIDASNVYGSDAARAADLRTFADGKLRMGVNDLLPFNINGLANAGGPGSNLFIGGDIRANEQVGDRKSVV